MSNKGGNQNPSGKNFHDSRQGSHLSNDKNPPIRDNTLKHQYEDHDEKLTNDENFNIYSRSGMNEEMDFRDRNDNLKAEHDAKDDE